MVFVFLYVVTCQLTTLMFAVVMVNVLLLMYVSAMQIGPVHAALNLFLLLVELVIL